MNDYAQQIIVKQHMSELLRDAENRRLARRARVHRDGSIGFASRVASAATSAIARVGTAARGIAAPTTDRVARA